MENKLKITLLFFLFVNCLESQKLHPPLDIPLEIAGNFCELRGSHFHSGMDFRTQGKENLSVYAVADGYISRIAVLPRGYGKVLYISHPQIGLMSVLAHLNSFNNSINSYITEYQYKTNQNSFDISVEETILPVRKGEILGKSGNTGSSVAPHLHFELRDLKTEAALNPEYFYPEIIDRLKPKVNFISLYRRTENTTKWVKKIVRNPKNDTFEIVNTFGKIGLGISSIDYYTDQKNTMGIYKLSLFDAAKKELYQLRFDSMSFANQGQIKAVQETEIEKLDNSYKLFLEPCATNIFDNPYNGWIELPPNSIAYFYISIQDFKKNTIEIPIKIITKAIQPEHTDIDSNFFLDCAIQNNIKNSKFELNIPPNTLICSRNLSFKPKADIAEPNSLYSIQILSAQTACMKGYSLGIGVDTSEDNSKYFLQVGNGDKKKTYEGQVKNGFFRVSGIKNFGNIYLRQDTIPPTITLSNEPNTRSFRFKINDLESGVKDYSIWVNGEWQPSYYDEKNNILIYSPNINKNKTSKILIISVKDQVGNKTEKKIELNF